MMKIYIKEKRFLKNFAVILLMLLIIVILTVGAVYQMSMNALEQEIENMNLNTAYEMQTRVEEVLQQCNQIASRHLVDSKVQLYFTHAEPNFLISNYYQEIDSKLNSHGIFYIDSILVYSSKYERMIRGNKSYSINELQEGNMIKDITWLELVRAQEGKTTDVVIRARNDIWPYYVSIVKKWVSGSSEGSIVLNIDLVKLYDHLMAGRDASMQLFLVDENQQVILEKDKQSLYVPVSERAVLNQFRPGESFSEIRSMREESYIYAQVYSETYGLTCVTYTKLGDYYTQIVEVQQRIVLIAIISILVAITVASVYSIKLVRPLQELQKLLDSPVLEGTDTQQYDENIREIAGQIVSQLQTNSRLREELDSRLDLLKDTQMLALQAQINPHFLFNTLNIISLTVESDCGNAHPGVHMLSVLSSILRYSLSECNSVSILEEIEFVQKYLVIMQYRYEEFETDIDVDENLYHYTIPKLVLQPLVENALQHGMSGCMSVRRGALKIKAREIHHTYESGQELPSICIIVEDNGIGMDEECLRELRNCIDKHGKISRKHIGLYNVAQRFYLLFGDKQEITLDSVFGQGTQIQIIFPAILCEETSE